MYAKHDTGRRVQLREMTHAHGVESLNLSLRRTQSYRDKGPKAAFCAWAAKCHYRTSYESI
jgi:hypothetical protein